MFTKHCWHRLWEDESGAEIVEYALVFALFALVSIAAVQVLATQANNAVEGDETNFSNSLVNGY